VTAPKGKLRAQMMPPIRVTQTIKAKKLTEPKPGVYIFDLGQNIPGWVKLKLQGPRGTKVTLRYSECLDDKGMIDQRAIKKHIRSGRIQEDVYILKGEGVEERQTHFTYHGFQYVEVSGLAEKPSLDDLEGMVVHTDFETIGKFECSNKLINDIHNLALWSYRGNYHGYPTDCPQREKNGWSGDAHLAAEMGMFNFQQAASYSKWLDDWADEQQPDGTLAAIIPTAGWGYKWGNGPAWDSAFILIPWYVYLYNGDTRILEDHFEGMKKYVDRMGKWAKKDQYIIEYGLGDWCPAKSKTSRDLTSTGYYYTDALIISKAAGILGKKAEQKKYALLAEAIRAAFNKHFYKGHRSGVYGKGTQTANSCALYQGLAEANEVPHIVKKLVGNIKGNDEHLDVGILGSKYLFNALTENGQHDLAYRIATKTTSPSYGHWVELGATTMWESWRNEPLWVSFNHIMFGDIDAWFYKHLAGINYDPETPGFKHIIIHPRPTGDLAWAKAEHQSPHGLIKTSWSIKNKKFSLDVTVPVNTTATVYIPGKNITEGKSPAAKAKGVSFLRMEKGTSVFKVESGSYQFTAAY
jgi:alpha-L-rhamnosidase